jgi:hypothetical protein
MEEVGCVVVFPVRAQSVHETAKNGTSFNVARQYRMIADVHPRGANGYLPATRLTETSIAAGPFVIDFDIVGRTWKQPLISVSSGASLLNGSLELHFRVVRGVSRHDWLRITVHRDETLVAEGLIEARPKLSVRRRRPKAAASVHELTPDDLCFWWLHE